MTRPATGDGSRPFAAIPLTPADDHAHDAVPVPRRRRQVLLWGMALALVVLSGCGGADGGGGTAGEERPRSVADDEAEPSAPGVATGDGASAVDDGGEDLVPVEVTDDTPVSYLSMVSGGRTLEKTSSLEVDARAGDCMRELGFDYVPLVSPATNVVADYRTVGEWREFTESRGYGMYWYETEEGLAATQEIVDQIEAEGQRSVPDADLPAYMEALIGDPDTPMEAASANIAAQSDGEGGCLAEATASVREEQGLPVLSEELLDGLREIDFSTMPEFQAASDAWSACMAEAGFEYDRFGDAESGFAKDYAQGVDRGPDAAEPRWLEEHEVAVADVECSIEHVLPVQLALERRAIVELAEQFPELAQFVDALG